MIARFFSNLLDRLSEFFAHRKGLLPIIGIIFILVNLALQIIPAGWLTQTNFFFHIGVILAIFGFILASAL